MIPITRNEVHRDLFYAEVSTLLKSAIQKVLDDGGILKNSPRRLIPFSNQLEDYLTQINDYAEIKNIIIANPEDLQYQINAHFISLPQLFNRRSNDYEIAYKIFIKQSYEKIDKLNFVNEIGLSTCPYCNRNYTFSLDRNKKIKPEIDHFYPKSIHPLLAVSYFNLIPSCQTCNGVGVKGNTSPYFVGLKSPYLISNSDFKFSYRFKPNEVFKSLYDNDSIDVFFEKKIQPNSDLFRLEDLYKKHNDHVAELIVKSRVKYSKKYREYLKSYKELKLTDDEINRMILGNYSNKKDLHKRPLAKIYQDIGEELGLI